MSNIVKDYVEAHNALARIAVLHQYKVLDIPQVPALVCVECGKEYPCPTVRAGGIDGPDWEADERD